MALNGFEEVQFRARAAEAAKWCACQLQIEDPAGSLRSEALLPSLIHLESKNQGNWNYETANPHLIVEELCRKRAELIRDKDAAKNISHLRVFGRILLFYPRQTLADGAAWQSSRGFFDYWNIPPWDTWVWYGRDAARGEVLYSWVPQELLGLVSDGVIANPENCIEWAAHSLRFNNAI